MSQDDLLTIADRGTLADFVNQIVAQILMAKGIVDGIHLPGKDVQIQFGVESVKLPVKGVIHGNGLNGKFYLLNEAVPIFLISDISMVEKGLGFIEDNDQRLIALAGGRVVVMCLRNDKAKLSESNAMWRRLHLRELFIEEDPSLRCEDNEKLVNLPRRK